MTRKIFSLVFNFWWWSEHRHAHILIFWWLQNKLFYSRYNGSFKFLTKAFFNYANSIIVIIVYTVNFSLIFPNLVVQMWTYTYGCTNNKDRTRKINTYSSHVTKFNSKSSTTARALSSLVHICIMIIFIVPMRLTLVVAAHSSECGGGNYRSKPFAPILQICFIHVWMRWA